MSKKFLFLVTCATLFVSDTAICSQAPSTGSQAPSTFDMSDFAFSQREPTRSTPSFPLQSATPESSHFVDVRSANDVKAQLGDFSLLKNTVVFIDADYTLITPEDRFGQPQDQMLWQQKIVKELINKRRPLGRKLGKEEFYTQESVYTEVIQLIVRSMTYCIIDPGLIELARELQAHRADVFVLTALGFPMQDALAWRAHMLEYDLKFPLTRPSCIEEPVYWHKEGSSITTGYSRGVIQSGSQGKGDAVRHFMDKVIGKRYEKIIFIDNADKYLKSVGEMCAKENIPYQGLKWIWEPFNMQITLNEKVTELQGRTLISTGELLSYAAALDVVSTRGGSSNEEEEDGFGSLVQTMEEDSSHLGLGSSTRPITIG